jgi:hypothetical protein
MNKLRVVIISDKRVELLRGDEPIADISCDAVKTELTILNTPRLVVYCGHEVNTYWPDVIEDKREVVPLPHNPLSTIESNHKGEWCPHDRQKYCQEGICSTCEVYRVKIVGVQQCPGIEYCYKGDSNEAECQTCGAIK